MYNKNHRHTIRLKGYDYSNKGMYFITICTKDRQKIFGIIQNEIMHLSICGKIAENTLMKIENNEQNKISMINYVIMPNHIHLILEIKNNNQIRLKDFITSYKSQVTKKINKRENIVVWQRNYYEHIIRNENELQRIIEYIKYNPINWKDDSLNA